MSILSHHFKFQRGYRYYPSTDGVNGLRMVQNKDCQKPSTELYVLASDFEYAMAEVLALRKHLSDLSTIFNQDISQTVDNYINERLHKLNNGGTC